MRWKDVAVGRRVECLREFVGVPSGTRGVIDEIYGGERHAAGCMVAWDLPDRPLPADYTAYDGRSAATPGAPLRDGFSRRELRYLRALK